jgi:hypothetical protein
VGIAPLPPQPKPLRFFRRPPGGEKRVA